MKKIVGFIQPFAMRQNFYVYENGNKIDAISINMNEINEQVIDLSQKYQIFDVDIIGPKTFSKGVGNKLLEAEVTKYNENKINIRYV